MCSAQTTGELSGPGHQREIDLVYSMLQDSRGVTGTRDPLRKVQGMRITQRCDPSIERMDADHISHPLSYSAIRQGRVCRHDDAAYHCHGQAITSTTMKHRKVGGSLETIESWKQKTTGLETEATIGQLCLLTQALSSCSFSLLHIAATFTRSIPSSFPLSYLTS